MKASVKQDVTGLEPTSCPANDGVQVPARFRIWVEKEQDFSMNKVSSIRHNFQDHPLFQLDKLESLAHRLLPHKQCRFAAQGVTHKSEFLHFDKSPEGKDLDHVFRNISEPGSWIALYNAQLDPAYAQVAEEALATVKHLVERDQPGIFRPELYFFISSAPSITPFHIDRVHNFWLQLRGRKILSTWDPGDRTVVPAPIVENFIVDNSLHEVILQDEFMSRQRDWDVGASEGVFMPSTSPHTARTCESSGGSEDSVSVSAALAFYTETTRKIGYIHSFNRVLRRFGASPKFPGESRFDSLKPYLGQAVVGLRKRFRDYEPPAGFEHPELRP